MPPVSTANYAVFGPFHSADRRFVSFVCTHPTLPPIGLSGRKEDTALLSDHVAEYLAETGKYLASRMQDWTKGPGFSVILRPRNPPNENQLSLKVYTYNFGATDPAEMAKEVQAGLVEVHPDATRQIIRESAPGEDFERYQVVFGKDNLSQRIWIHQDSQIGLDELTKMEPELDEMHIALYEQEALTYTKAEKPDIPLAFRSFFYLDQLAARYGGRYAERCILTGLPLLQLFEQHLYPDHLEYVARRTAETAQLTAQMDIAGDAYRFAAIASEQMGWINTCLDYYQRSQEALKVPEAAEHRAKTEMSRAISINLLLWPRLFGQPVGAPDLPEQAVGCVRQAMQMLEETGEKAPSYRLAALKLEMALSTLFLDQPAVALQQLEQIRSEGLLDRWPRLAMTEIAYRLLALRAQSPWDDDQRAETYGRTLLASGPSLLKGPVNLRFLYFLLYGEMMGLAGEWKESAQALENALTFQRLLQRRLIRPTPPDSPDYGGWLAIDVAGRYQEVVLLDATTGEQDPALFLRGFITADQEKGFYFARDLFFSFRSLTQRLSDARQLNEDGLRRLAVEGRIDPRIIQADMKWFIERDVSKEERKKFYDLNAPLDPEEVPDQRYREFIEGMPEQTVLLSFYQEEERTRIYLLRPHDYRVVMLPVGRRQLGKILRSVHTGIAGNTLYPRINPQEPESHDRFFAPFFELQEFFNTLTEMMGPVRHLLLSPHEGWHELPLHALLLPVYWEKGDRPALTYLPSLDIYRLLQERARNQDYLRLRDLGLLACCRPGHAEEVHFKAAFDQLLQAASRKPWRLSPLFGEQATDLAYLRQCREVEVQHLLAHGLYQATGNPLESGLLLREDSAPSQSPGSRRANGSTVLSYGLRASHVSLQACSLGRSRPGQGDEFWGFGRALLAAGADSIIAPLWDISLHSSTTLFSDFYDLWLGQHLSKAEAWTESQRRMAMGSPQKAWRHFYHWAAFRLVGTE